MKDTYIFDNKVISSIQRQGILDSEQIIYDYCGIFDQKYVRESAQKLSKLTDNYPLVQRKIFTVFVELAQNIGYYSDQRKQVDGKDIGVGNLLIYKSDNEIGFHIGNIINKTAMGILHRKCIIINSLEQEALREFKRYQRNLIQGTNGGAHIGLIMVSLTTKRKLDFKITEINKDMVFFNLNIKLKKEN